MYQKISNKLSIGSQNLGPINGIGDIGSETGGATTLDRLISTGVGILTVVGAIFFLFNLITGATAIISAGGDKGKYEEARTKITQSIIGLVVVIAAFFIADVIMVLLGLEGILDLPSIITQISQ